MPYQPETFHSAHMQNRHHVYEPTVNLKQDVLHIHTLTLTLSHTYIHTINTHSSTHANPLTYLIVLLDISDGLADICAGGAHGAELPAAAASASSTAAASHAVAVTAAAAAPRDLQSAQSGGGRLAFPPSGFVL